jgi:hypothetical protein
VLITGCILNFLYHIKELLNIVQDFINPLNNGYIRYWLVKNEFLPILSYWELSFQQVFYIKLIFLGLLFKKIIRS